MDSHDGGTAASWFWTSCQSVVGGIQDAFEGMLILNSSTDFLPEKRSFPVNRQYCNLYDHIQLMYGAFPQCKLSIAFSLWNHVIYLQVSSSS